MAGGHHQFGGIGGVHRAKSFRLARDAGINFAVHRTHGEFIDRSLGHVGLHRHFRCTGVSRADDEVAVGIRRRNGAVGQLLGGDISGRVRIAGGRRWACRRSHCRICASHQIQHRAEQCGIMDYFGNLHFAMVPQL